MGSSSWIGSARRRDTQALAFLRAQLVTQPADRPEVDLSPATRRQAPCRELAHGYQPPNARDAAAQDRSRLGNGAEVLILRLHETRFSSAGRFRLVLPINKNQQAKPAIAGGQGPTLKMPEEWALAGLPDTDGDLERPVPGQWAVPGRLELDAGWLLYGSVVDEGGTLELGPDLAADLSNAAAVAAWADAEPVRGAWRPSGPASHRAGLLTDFVALSDLDARRLAPAVLRYARRHGVLRICEHGLPTSHNSRCKPLSWPREPFTESDPWWDGREPVAAWFTFSSQARAMLNIAAQLRLGRPASEDDWKVLIQPSVLDPDHAASLASHQVEPLLSPVGRPIPEWHPAVRRPRQELLVHVESWLSWGAVRPIVQWPDEGKPQFETAGKGLFGALAFQLLLNVTSQGGYAACRYCGRDFTPSRQGRLYCKPCTDSGDARRAIARASARKQRKPKPGARSPLTSTPKPKEASR
jgi:hypothetical protein